MLLLKICNEPHSDCHKKYDTFVILLPLLFIVNSISSARFHCYLFVPRNGVLVLRFTLEDRKSF
jgi:hypothetical protein